MSVPSPMDGPPYRDAIGRFRTSSLFLETFDTTLDTALYRPYFTLADNDRTLNPTSMFYSIIPNHTLPSLRKIYLQYSDPSEYAFAFGTFKNDKQWKVLLKCKWFHPYIDEWRDSLDAKIRSESVAQMRRTADSGGPGAIQAAKWLAEGGYREKQLKGRPSALDKKDALQREISVDKLLQEDAERIGIKTNAS